MAEKTKIVFAGGTEVVVDVPTLEVDTTLTEVSKHDQPFVTFQGTHGPVYIAVGQVAYFETQPEFSRPVSVQ